MRSHSTGQAADVYPVGASPHPHARVSHERTVLARKRTSQDRIAGVITSFAGTLRFVYIHAAWFGVWITVNLGALGNAAIFDPYPFGLLAVIVSLEAIFLSTFVMVSQNRHAARENVRADLDFENNVRSEVWSVHIGKELGLDPESIERRVQEIIGQSRAEISDAANRHPTLESPSRAVDVQFDATPTAAHQDRVTDGRGHLGWLGGLVARSITAGALITEPTPA